MINPQPQDHHKNHKHHTFTGECFHKSNCWSPPLRMMPMAQSKTVLKIVLSQGLIAKLGTEMIDVVGVVLSTLSLPDPDFWFSLLPPAPDSIQHHWVWSFQVWS